MASIADMIAASTDTDLRARVRAAADARAGCPSTGPICTWAASMTFDAIDTIAAGTV